MRRLLPSLLLLIAFPVSGFAAKDVYLAIGGSAGVFRTDARIFNPSFEKDIVVAASYLPAGNLDNSAVAPKMITIPKRSMAVYDNVVLALFGIGPPLGAIRLTSDDDFLATQRIYADESATPKNGTLGQFVPGLEAGAATEKGVLIQLKANGSRGTAGTFRTNWGGANPNGVIANVSLTLHDRANAAVMTKDVAFQPYGVLAPASITDLFENPSNDLTDAWISFESDQPVFLYASVLDNGSEDPTFFPALHDSGTEPGTPPQQKTVTVTAQNWFFSVTPSAALAAGDEVKFIITASENTHGFRLVSPAGASLLSVVVSHGEVLERTVELPIEGTYTYFCTVTTCGTGHNDMNGTLAVGSGKRDPGEGY